MLECLGHAFDPVSREAPPQAGPPHRGIRRAAAPTGIEPPLGVIVGAGTDRQVGSAKPDPVIVGGQPAHLIEINPKAFDRGSFPGEVHVHTNQLDRLFRRRLARGVQVFPPLFDQLLRFVRAADLAVKRHEQTRRSVASLRGSLTASRMSCSASASRPVS